MMSHAGSTPVAPAQSIMGLPAESSYCHQVLNCLTGGAASTDSRRPERIEPTDVVRFRSLGPRQFERQVQILAQYFAV